MLEMLGAFSVVLSLALFVRLGEVRKVLREFLAERRNGTLERALVMTGESLLPEGTTSVDPLQQMDKPESLSDMQAYFRGAQSPRGWETPMAERHQTG